MRIIDFKQLKELVPYSRVHIARLEQSGKFPMRVQLGEHRCGWVYEEVQDWLQRKAEARYTNDLS